MLRSHIKKNSHLRDLAREAALVYAKNLEQNGKLRGFKFTQEKAGIEFGVSRKLVCEEYRKYVESYS